MPPVAKPKLPSPAEKKSGKKKFLAIGALLTSTPFLIAVAIHVLLLIGGSTVVIFQGGNPLAIFTSQEVGEGDAEASVEAPPPPDEVTPEPESEPMAMEAEVTPTEIEESSDILALSTPSTVPSFAPPAPSKVSSTGASPGRSVTMGSAPRPGKPGRPRTGGSLFGFSDTREDDLIGTMIDLKTDSSGKKPTGLGPKGNPGVTDDDFYKACRELLAGNRVNESALRRYFAVPKRLGATQLFIPYRQADEAPRSFGVADKVKPNFWVIHYKGRFSAPVSGQYRFVGKADDLLWVAVEGKTVLEAHWDNNNFLTSWRPEDHINEHSIYDFMEGNTEDDKKKAFLTYGDWMKLEAGKPKDLEILLGEYGGGRFFAVLMIQEKSQWEKAGGKKIKDRPVMPLFLVAEPNSEQKRDIRNSKIEFPKDREFPIFAAAGAGPVEEPSPAPEPESAPAPSTVSPGGRTDTASSPAYQDDWRDGVGAADGWEGWVLRSNGNNEKKSYAGFYIAKQEERSGSSSVATEGKSFGIFADGDGFQESAAFRSLTKPLEPNQSLSLDLVTPLPKGNAGNPGSIGLTLRTGRKADGPGDYNAGARFELTALEGQGNYQIYDGGDRSDSGLPVTPAGLRVEFTLKTPDRYDLKLSPLTGGTPMELKDRKLGGTAGSPLESLAIFNRDSEQNAFFNRLRLNP